MNYQYTPRGVCSTRFDAEVNDEGILESLFIKDGCSGNGKGLAQLAKGRHIDEIITLLDGVVCGRKPTSCPDQLAKMLISIRNEREKQTR